MIRRLKNIAVQLATLLKHGSVLKGGSVVIKNSTVSHHGVEIFDHAGIRNSTVGDFSKVYNFSVITGTSLLGNNKIGKQCSISNSIVGEHSYIADFSIVNNTKIGKFCSVGPGFKCGLGSHPDDFISSSPFFYQEQYTSGQTIYEEYADITIGNDVWIGANVFIKDGIKIGDGAILAAGSVVLKNVEDYAIVGGVPAKLIRYRHDEAVRNFLQNLKWWDKDAAWLKSGRDYFQNKISSLEDINNINS
jgi:acetyltransferase-like isoleucine patch superfamily enzyme